MPAYCAAVNCFSKSREGVRFHRFPSDEFYCKKWILAVRRKDFVPNKWSVVCHKHFTPDCYTWKSGVAYLNKYAVPSIFDYTSGPKYKPRKCAKNAEIGKKIEIERRFPICPAVERHEGVIDPLYTDRRDLNDYCASVLLKHRSSEQDSSECKSPCKDITAELRYQDVMNEMNRRTLESTTTMPVIINLTKPNSSLRRIRLPVFVKEANKKIYTILTEVDNANSKLVVNDTNIDITDENISQLLVNMIDERNGVFPKSKYKTHIIMSNHLEKLENSGRLFSEKVS